MWTSSQPTETGRESCEPPRTRTPIAGDVVLLGAVFNLGYAAAIIYALAHPDGRFGAAVSTWVEIAGRLLRPVYGLAGGARCGGGAVSAFAERAWVFDVHLTAINLIAAALLFAASRRYWAAWAQPLRDAPDGRDITPEAWRQTLDTGFGTVLWGTIAALWWLTLENHLFESAARCATLQPWFLVREPLLTTIAHGVASFAAVLSLARKSSSGAGATRA